MATLVNLIINGYDVIGDEFDPNRASAYLTPNTPHGVVVVDSTAIRLGGKRIKFDQSGNVTYTDLVATNSADNPTSFAYRVTIVYTPIGARKQEEWTSSDFTLTASANLASISEAFDGLAIAPTWQSEFRDEMEDIRDGLVAISGPVDSTVEALVKNQGGVGPLTKTALDAQYAPVKTAVGGDETASINTFLAAASPLGAKRLVGSFSVSGQLTVPAGLYLDLTAATITQTGSNQKTLVPGAGATILGGRLVGKGTDYVATTTPSPAAIGIWVNAAGVRVMQTRLEQHANAGLYINASDFNATAVRIDGVATTQTIPANDAACFGVYINGGSRHSFTDVDIRGVSIGIIGPVGSTYLSMTNVRISNVLGQHGVYLQDATGLNVNGLQVSDIALHGFKVQLYSAVAADSIACSINGVTANNCGDTAVILYNSDTDLTSAKRIRGLTISNIAASTCSRTLYLGSIRGGTVTNVTSRNTTSSAMVIIDCQDLLVANFLSEGSGRMGIHGVTATGAATQRVRFSDVRIKSPAANNVASNVYGVYIDGGGSSEWTEVTFDGLDISSGNAFMVYGFFFGGGEQETLRVRNAVLAGATSAEARLATGPRAVAEWSNVRMANSATPVNFPTTALPSGGTGLTNDYFNNAAPTTGTWRRGDRVWNNAPAASGTMGWVCTTAGSPGTWKTFAAISA